MKAKALTFCDKCGRFAGVWDERPMGEGVEIYCLCETCEGTLQEYINRYPRKRQRDQAIYDWLHKEE